MKLLAIDTSCGAGSIALFDQGELCEEVILTAEQGTARSLAPAISLLLERTTWRMADVKLIATTVGPGSFTGLRVGVCMTKTLAYALGVEVLGVNTLEVLAEQAADEARRRNFSRIYPVVDAYRGQFFTAAYCTNANETPPATDDNPRGALVEQQATMIIDRQKWLETLPSDALATGPGLSRLDEEQRTSLADKPVAEEQSWAPRAATVGHLAWRMVEAGQRHDLWRLAPQYYRQSAAEEKRGGG